MSLADIGLILLLVGAITLLAEWAAKGQDDSRK